MHTQYAIGIDAGGTKVAYGLYDAKGTLVDRHQHPTDVQADGPAFTDGLITSVEQMLAKHGLQASDLLGVGVCMPSFILYDQGYIYMTSAMENIRDFAMRDYMVKRLPTRIVLDNDSNVAALAEHRHGAGQGMRHMVYMSASTGLGSGLILDGKLFRGSYGWAGESGHMLATPGEGILCGCRNQGCFMSYASGRYACQHAAKQIAAGRQSVLADCADVTGERLLTAYRGGDALAAEILDQMAHYMALCLFNVYQLLNVNQFVFGGGLVNFGDALFGKVRREFDRYNHIPLPVEFHFAKLEKDIGITGAADLILAGGE